ncbi:hypothetical protein BU24DRAFT_24296 [Aaosphaeria arxii CBS 175.79]|uniref:Uncharacterized protein n=1 Tax=Aaosphaeria arxii CBS 175.79 TaxID=1450172 RepID=A0A6A5Y8H2_9PLEO|nr:uncharacterized protein BU24DRAFT_24296 [Aaosphaeria arxii CBS 175.79]KAF2021629.1 hypothetical protein BU24DRAFT_24296 [Aaosphaeria arxii CBS 175.79]
MITMATTWPKQTFLRINECCAPNPLLISQTLQADNASRFLPHLDQTVPISQEKSLSTLSIMVAPAICSTLVRPVVRSTRLLVNVTDMCRARPLCNEVQTDFWSE